MSSSKSSGLNAPTFRIRPGASPAGDVSDQAELVPPEPMSHKGGTRTPPRSRSDNHDWPTQARDSNDVASRLVAEFFERRDRGENPQISDYAGRFPDTGRPMAEMIRAQEVVRSLGGKKMGLGRVLRLPEVGDVLFGFRLRRPLGSGAFARVFVAEQSDLAGRKVVLKISAIEGNEPQTLARLQHTNIVPIHSVHEDPRIGLRAVCMPYLGGATLWAALDHLWQTTDRPVRGTEFVEALQRVRLPSIEELNREEGQAVPEAPAGQEATSPLTALGQLSYFKAVALIVAELAEGLQHAHQRGILHRDIKPSNILVSEEGQPLLLDFNVSQETSGDSAQAMIGGTVAYASPEHLRAMIERSAELIPLVDRRSDIYSLGLVLAEMLTGERIFEQSGSYSAVPTQLEAMAVERGRNAPSLRLARGDTPWGLESIARKCLDPDPAKRYQQAEQLADDLRRFVEDRPLKHAPERSLIERAHKFLRRHPRLTAAGPLTAAAMVSLLFLGGALLGANQHIAATGARERKQAHDAGTLRALCLVNTTLGKQDHLSQGVAVCEETLGLYKGPNGQPPDQDPDWLRLPPEERRQLAEDRRELLLLLAGARARLGGEQPSTWKQALATLDQAEAIPGLAPSKALWLDRASYLDKLGETDQARAARAKADAIVASTSRDYYLLATSYVRDGGTDRYLRAIRALNEALRLNPRDYWSTLQRGICRMELGESAQAAGDFGACIGLWPEHPWGYFNRGYVLDRGGLKAEAVEDYTDALQRDPNFVEALVNRGLARLELKAFGPALADFDRAIALDPADSSSQAGRAMALEGLGRSEAADDAFDAALKLVKPGDPARTRLLWSQGFAVARRLPAKARALFDEVLRDHPQHPQALYGRAMLAMTAGDLDVALDFFNHAIEADPGFVEARRYRAVVLARRREWDRAGRDINWCLEREPRSGTTLYAAACVAARAAESMPNTSARDQALELLRRARELGSGRDAADDPDLASLQKDPRFARVLATTPVPDGNASPDAAQNSTQHP